MSIKSLKVLSGAAFAALLFVSVAGSAFAAMPKAAEHHGIMPGVPVANASLAAQNAVVQGG